MTASLTDNKDGRSTWLRRLTNMHTRKSLQEELDMYKAIIDSSDDAIISKTFEGRITSWNLAAEQLFGYAAQEAIGQLITLIIPTELHAQEANILRQLSQGRHVQPFETTRLRKDGTRVEVSSGISPIKDSTGKIIGAAEIARDITERKRHQAQEQFLTEVSKVLASTLDYQETLANIARLIVPELADWFTVDMISASGDFELIEIVHKDPEQVHWGRALRERYPIDPNAPTGIPRVARTGQSELYTDIPDELLVATARDEEELVLARKLGYSSAMMVPLIARGATIGVISFVATESGKHFDEHDLALAEEVGRRAGVALDNARLYREVKQARDQFDIILQGVADGILVYDSSSRVMYANEVGVRMNGYNSIQEIQTERPFGIVDRFELIDEQGKPFPRSRLTHQRVLAGELEAQAIIGYRERASTRSERWSLVKSRPVFDENGRVALVISIIHDITERMNIERRKDEFISMAGHELKTPVTSLKGFLYMLQHRLAKQGDERELHYLSRMDAQIKKLTRLIDDLLDISRMQLGKLTLQAEPIDLDTLIDETVENVQATTSTHHLLIEGRTGAQVVGDQEHLGQVFTNLLTNAIKYSPQANKVLVRLEQDEEQVYVHIQDFGIGIDKAHHEKIFERFYRVTGPEEQTYPGLGIGLYISSEIVARHQGHMRVESRKGEGSTFTVALPYQQAREQA